MRIIVGSCLGLILGTAACAPVPDSGNPVYLEAVTPTARQARDAELQASNADRSRAVAAVTLEPIDPMRRDVSPTASAAVETVEEDPVETIETVETPEPAEPVESVETVATPAPVVTPAPAPVQPAATTQSQAPSAAPTPAPSAPAATAPRREVAQPGSVPRRSSSSEPNVVAYALATSHPVGEARYGRNAVSDTRTQRACARYASPDQAQTAFLRAGGPERDGQGLDPDGDGYACAWTPEPFRRAVSRN